MEFWATEYTKLASMVAPITPGDPNFAENVNKFDSREGLRHALFSLGASGLGSIGAQELIEPGWGPAIGGALAGSLVGSGVAGIGEKGRAERLGLKVAKQIDADVGASAAYNQFDPHMAPNDSAFVPLINAHSDFTKGNRSRAAMSYLSDRWRMPDDDTSLRTVVDERYKNDKLRHTVASQVLDEDVASRRGLNTMRRILTGLGTIGGGLVGTAAGIDAGQGDVLPALAGIGGGGALGGALGYGLGSAIRSGELHNDIYGVGMGNKKTPVVRTRIGTQFNNEYETPYERSMIIQDNTDGAAELMENENNPKLPQSARDSIQQAYKHLGYRPYQG